MSFAEFCRNVLRIELWPHQVEVAESDAFVTAVAKARRTGGSVLAEALAIFTAFESAGSKVIYLSATQDAARRATESIGARLSRSPAASVRSAVVDDFATRVRLANGSAIISLPASQRQVRGYGEGVRLVILDEAGFMPSELWTAAHYTALDERANGSRILMVGTPWGGADHFFRQAFQAGQAGDPDHASFHWTHAVNPNLDAAYLERQRDRVSPPEYAAEVLGEWSDAVGSLFPGELLDRQTADLELPGSIAELPRSARGAMGFDYGVSFDRSAVVADYRLAGLQALNPDREPLPTFVAIPFLWPVKTPLSDVVRDVLGVPVLPRFAATETSGVGAMPSQELRAGSDERERVERTPVTWAMVHTSSAIKSAGYGCVLGLLERGQLVLPRHPDLLRQLRGLRFEQGERGFTRIEADRPATHDDLGDALMLSTLPYSDRGRVRCHLAICADPRRAAAEMEVPVLDVDVVETGGGLRLYRRPPLQSVSAGELSLPPGVTQPGATRRPPRADDSIPTMRRAVGAPARPPGPARRARPWRRIK